jgi:transmembrane sensor
MSRSNPEPDTSRERELPALDWIRHAHAADEVLRDAAVKIRRQRTRRLRLGGGALLVLLGAWASFHFTSERSAPSPLPASGVAHVSTPAAASTALAATAQVTRPATRTLSDGTVVELNADAEIAVAFTRAVRYVTLVRGTAHFQVAKDAAHPFVVRAGNVETRAVGTAFSVQHGARDVGVVVTEGRVRVTSHVETDTTLAADSLPHAFVDAGLRCVVEPDATPRVEPLPAAQLAAELAWRIPQLEFSRAPLREVVALVNAHAAGVTYEITDPALGDIKLTGILRADNTEGFERLLETSFHLHLERMPGKVQIHALRE